MMVLKPLIPMTFTKVLLKNKSAFGSANKKTTRKEGRCKGKLKNSKCKRKKKVVVKKRKKKKSNLGKKVNNLDNQTKIGEVKKLVGKVLYNRENINRKWLKNAWIRPDKISSRKYMLGHSISGR